MDEIRRRLPKELYLLMIDKYFEKSSCVSLALSGAFDEFSSVYTPSRLALLKNKAFTGLDEVRSRLIFVLITGNARAWSLMRNASSLHQRIGLYSSINTSLWSPFPS